jgi:hypothetical protein
MQDLSLTPLKYLSLKYFPFPSTWLPWLKGLSSGVVTLTIVLLVGYAILRFHQEPIPRHLTMLTMLGSFALAIHLLEAIVAMLLNRSQRSAGQVMLTTFLFGTIGLMEVLDQRRSLDTLDTDSP